MVDLSDLIPYKAITKNITKAYRAYFSYGSIGTSHDDFNPLSRVVKMYSEEEGAINSLQVLISLVTF